ncbi:hypothetical protein ABEF95_011292 [Exophiala dermatitidis]
MRVEKPPSVFGVHPSARKFLGQEFVEMMGGIDEQKELTSSSGAFVDMIKGTDLRRTIICFDVILSHSSSGDILLPDGGCQRALPSVYNLDLRESCGVLLGISVAYTVVPKEKPTGKAIVACTLLWGFFYNGFFGSLSWPIADELVSSRLRVISIGIGTAINYFFSLFFFFCLPEMKGGTLEEIDELFQNRVSVRHFPKYECVSSSTAREIAVKEAHILDTDAEKDAFVEHSVEVKV